jgi:Ca2+-binding EF-hand superfamily protein
MTLQPRSFLVAALAAAPALWALTATAGERPGGMLAKADLNGDGTITRQELAAYRDATAARMDANKDGFITTDEMQAYILARMTAKAERMAAARIKAGDTDGDGRLSLAEEEAMGEGRIDKLFARADTNGDGVISADELTALRAKWVRKKAD